MIGAEDYVSRSMGYDSNKELEKKLPDNVSVYRFTSQEVFYSDILSKVDCVLKMDNPPGVGRICAEAAAAGIPCIAANDLFQIRCFPELIVNSSDNIEEYNRKLEFVSNDYEFRDFISNISRNRLLASNNAEILSMKKVFNDIGLEFEIDDDLYW